MNDFHRFGRSLVKLKPRQPAKIIDSALLVRALREKRHGPPPAKLPTCDRCNDREASVFAGALAYCTTCWDRLGATLH